MRIAFFLLIASLFFTDTYAQPQFDPCDSYPTETEISILKESLDKFSSIELIKERSVTTIPIKVWVFGDSINQNEVSVLQIELVLQEANSAFNSAHLEFALCDTVTYISNTIFSDFNKSQESALKQLYYTNEVINFYLFNSLSTNSGVSLCGYAKYPGSSDLIAMDKNCLMDGSSFVHELGHFWGLYHTHGVTNQYLTYELVSGENCAVAGDDVCDTPADPNLRDYVFSDCVFDAEIEDQNGDFFSPDPFNYMSYSHPTCRSHFSDGQVLRIEYVHRYLRNYLKCSSHNNSMAISTNATLCDTTATVIYDYLGDLNNSIIKWDLHANGFIDYVGPTYEVHYDQPGNYDILMEVEINETTNSHFMKNAFQLFETKHLPYHLSFSTDEQQYQIVNPDEDQTWFVMNIDPYDQQSVITIDNYHNYQRTEQDAIMLPPIMLDGLTTANLKFDVAYAWHGNNYDDQLDVEISLDCGESYISVYSKSGSELASVEYTEESQWMPIDSSEWRSEVIDLSNYLGADIIVRFTNINDFGNQLYLSDIMVDGDPALAHKSLDLKGRKINDRHNRLQWFISDYASIESVWLESSIDGHNFQRISTIDLSIQPSGTYDHRYAKERDFYYRIAGNEFGKGLVYSNLAFIPGSSAGVLTIFPNPTAENIAIKLAAAPSVPAMYSGRIFNAQGKSVQKISGELYDSFESIPVDLSLLTSGVYYLELIIGNETYDSRFVKI